MVAFGDNLPEIQEELEASLVWVNVDVPATTMIRLRVLAIRIGNEIHPLKPDMGNNGQGFAQN